MKRFQILSLIGFTAMVAVTSCKKSKDAGPFMAPTQAHFTNLEGGNYYIQNIPNSTYKIPIGITNPVATDTKVTVSVSSPTGATAGVQYNLPSTSVTIKAGKTLDSLTVRGIFVGFPGSRVDTLIFTINGGDVESTAYNKTFKLVMQKYCTVDLAAFAGTVILNDADGSGDYSGTVDPVTAANYTSATSGYIMVNNLWDLGSAGNPIRVDLDWTDPGNFKTNVPTGQNFFVHPTYGQAKVKPNGTGTFSSCARTVQIKFQAYVTAGTFTSSGITDLRK